MYKIFVGGFPLEITGLQLAQMIAPHGEIVTIKIVRDKQTRKCKGYAFVEMLTEKDAAQVAAALDGTMRECREISVRQAVEKTKAVRPAPTNRPYAPAKPVHKPIGRRSDVSARAKRPRRTQR